MAKDRSIKDKRYEQKHKEERKAKYMIWGTSVPRKYAEEINEFLAKYGFTKVQLIEAGFKALIDEAAETDICKDARRLMFREVKMLACKGIFTTTTKVSFRFAT